MKGGLQVSEDAGTPRANTDLLDLWRQWYEANADGWSDLLREDGGLYADPYGLYQQWLESLKKIEQQTGAPTGTADRYEYWRRWTEAMVESWRRAVGLTPVLAGVAPRWVEMVGEFWQQMLGEVGPPVDPLDFYQRWYNAVSGPLSEIATDTLENESFLEYSRQVFRYYTTFDRVFRRLSEEYFGWLQLSTSADATRIAGLVVAVDERVDRLEEALEDSDYGREGVATAGDTEDLKERLERVEGRLGQLDRVEGKLDRLLEALETSTNGEEEVRATDAARRAAGELGVDLSEVEGTGAGGQITVSDVRERGGS